MTLKPYFWGEVSEQTASSRSLVFGGLFIILIYYLPFFIYGQDSPVDIHDNLDSTLAWIKMLMDNGALLASPEHIIPNIMNGMSRSALYPGYDLSLLFFHFFGLYYGYVFNKLLMSLVAFLGMHLLLRKHVTPSAPEVIVSGVALSFALLPHWSFNLNIAGLPLVFCLLLNARSGELTVRDLIIAVLYAFYSSVILVGIFILMIWAFVLARDLVHKKTVYNPLQQGILLLVIVLCWAVNYWPVISQFFQEGGFVSHRVEMVKTGLDTGQVLKSFEDIFKNGQFHVQSLHKYLILPLLFALYLQRRTEEGRTMFFMLIFLLISSLFYAILNWNAIIPFYNRFLSVLPVQLQRFHFLQPLAWYVFLALALAGYFRTGKWGRRFGIALLLFQLGYIVLHQAFLWRDCSPLPDSLTRMNPAVKGDYYMERERGAPSFNGFESKGQMDEIKVAIGKKAAGYRVLCIGFHPAIAQLNGIYTLDGYLASYPLTYKHQFRRIISGELDKDNLLRMYYDNWGSRAYALSSEIGHAYYNAHPPEITSLNYDFRAMKEMGCQYVISSTPVTASQPEDLKYMGEFREEGAFWTFYLYRVN